MNTYLTSEKLPKLVDLFLLFAEDSSFYYIFENDIIAVPKDEASYFTYSKEEILSFLGELTSNCVDFAFALKYTENLGNLEDCYADIECLTQLIEEGRLLNAYVY